MRRLSQQFISTVLEDFGLAAAVQDLCRTHGTAALQLHCAMADLPPLSLPLAQAIYRIAQELLLNTVQHAEATEAHFALTAPAGWLVLRADDDGQGFDPARPRRPA